MSAEHSQTDAICVRGLGLITPLGNDLETSWRRIVAGAAIHDHARAPLPAQRSLDRVTALGLAAAREAISRAGWSADENARCRTALVVGTSKGPVDDWIETGRKHFGETGGQIALAKGPRQDIAAPPPTSDKPSNPFISQASEIGLHTVAVGIEREIHLEVSQSLTVSCACATGIAALIRAMVMLQHGSADRVLVVATESSLHPLFIGSFGRLGVLAADGQPVRPMDQRRSGFLISEAAAAVCLERSQAKPGDLLIDQMALGADATHLTGIDPQARTLRTCLDRLAAGKPVDLVQAHATGTPLNDPIELAGIEDRIGRAIGGSPSVYSHKAAIGHSLGAAGLISVVLNCMAHRHNIVPGNIHTTQPLISRHVRIDRGITCKPIRRSLAIAAGFGGAVAGISLVSA